MAIIGAGAAGRSFGLRCAAAGFRVLLEDVMPANLRRAQQEYAAASPAGGRGSLETASTIEEAVREADLVVDFVPDELESKLEIFCLVDRMAPPRTVVLTPSDALSIADLASCTYRGSRCFAVRGLTSTAATLLHPPSADRDALTAVSAFLRALDLMVHVEPDREAPQLVR